MSIFKRRETKNTVWVSHNHRLNQVFRPTFGDSCLLQECCGKHVLNRFKPRETNPCVTKKQEHGGIPALPPPTGKTINTPQNKGPRGIPVPLVPFLGKDRGEIPKNKGSSGIPVLQKKRFPTKEVPRSIPVHPPAWEKTANKPPKRWSGEHSGGLSRKNAGNILGSIAVPRCWCSLLLRRVRWEPWVGGESAPKFGKMRFVPLIQRLFSKFVLKKLRDWIFLEIFQTVPHWKKLSRFILGVPFLFTYPEKILTTFEFVQVCKKRFLMRFGTLKKLIVFFIPDTYIEHLMLFLCWKFSGNMFGFYFLTKNKSTFSFGLLVCSPDPILLFLMFGGKYFFGTQVPR